MPSDRDRPDVVTDPTDRHGRREFGQALLETVSDLVGPALVTVRSRSVLASGLIGIGGCVLAVVGLVLMQTCMADYLERSAPPWLDPALRVALLVIAVAALIGGLTATKVRKAQVGISRLGIEITWETGEGEAVVGKTVRIAPEEIRELRRWQWIVHLHPFPVQSVSLTTRAGVAYEIHVPSEGMPPEAWETMRAGVWRRGEIVTGRESAARWRMWPSRTPRAATGQAGLPAPHAT